MQTEVKSKFQPLVEIQNNGIYRKYIKRAMDFILSLIAILVLSPLMLVIAILVRINLGSPVIFKQKRPGLNEKIFTLYKFRTMTDERDENGELLPDNVRLTKFGKLLRLVSLDELPQLFNILKGDMSIVGPRPLAIDYLPYYNEKERHRHDVRPGLTGLAQVQGRNNLSWEERFNYDIQYVNNVSFLLDVKLILKTVVKVFKREDIVVRGTGDVIDFHTYRSKQNNKAL
ncbi:MAG: sugar transferase [Caldicoprobacterales bacterium]